MIGKRAAERGVVANFIVHPRPLYTGGNLIPQLSPFSVRAVYAITFNGI